MTSAPRRSCAFLVVAATALALLAGCGTITIDNKKVESQLRQQYASKGVTLTSVSCPSGLTAKKGATFTCHVVATDGSKAAVTYREDDDHGGHATVVSVAPE